IKNNMRMINMNGDKKLEAFLEEYKKPIKKLFKYDKSKALTFDKESRSSVEDQNGIFVIFKNKEPLYVGQAGGFMTGYKLDRKSLIKNNMRMINMNGDKKLEAFLEEYKKPIKKLFKYDKSKALTFDKESRSSVEDQNGIFVIFKNKEPLYVGQAGGFMTGYKLTQKDLNDKLAQFNLKSDVGTSRFRK